MSKIEYRVDAKALKAETLEHLRGLDIHKFTRNAVAKFFVRIAVTFCKYNYDERYQVVRTSKTRNGILCYYNKQSFDFYERRRKAWTRVNDKPQLKKSRYYKFYQLMIEAQIALIDSNGNLVISVPEKFIAKIETKKPRSLAWERNQVDKFWHLNKKLVNKQRTINVVFRRLEKGEHQANIAQNFAQTHNLDIDVARAIISDICDFRTPTQTINPEAFQAGAPFYPETPLCGGSICSGAGAPFVPTLYKALRSIQDTRSPKSGPSAAEDGASFSFQENQDRFLDDQIDSMYGY